MEGETGRRFLTEDGNKKKSVCFLSSVISEVVKNRQLSLLKEHESATQKQEGCA